jgi:hypothetical protein
MTTKKPTTTDTSAEKEQFAQGATRGSRPERKKTYERPRNTQIPQELQDHFRKTGYEVRPIRYIVAGVEELTYLANREGEGYEFVTIQELPEWYLKRVRQVDTKTRNGLITVGDCCLMKIDMDLRQSRRDHFAGVTEKENEAVDIHSYTKKNFRTAGSKRQTVIGREPTFRD